MRTGNVIRCPSGSLWIVTDVHEMTVKAIAFDAESVSAVQHLDDYTREDICGCGDHLEFVGEPRSDCERCQGAGRYTRLIKGWGESEVLARSVKEFIMKRAAKVFDI